MPVKPVHQFICGLSSLALGAALAYRAWPRPPRYSFAGRTVIITGASKGLGFELARQLAGEGANLWLVARSHDALARPRPICGPQAGASSSSPQMFARRPTFAASWSTCSARATPSMS